VKSFRDRNPYAVGLASLLVIGLFTGAAFMVGLAHLLDKTYSMSGIFSDASGVKGGDDVKVAGVKVGRVTGVKPDRVNGNVIVTWVVNHGVRLGPDTHAEIALETLLGSKFIRLTGEVVEPYMEDVPADDRVIPIENTKTPFDVFRLTTLGTQRIEETNTEELNQFINDLADITEGKHQSVGDLLTGLDRVSRAINDRDAQLSQLLDRADTLSNTLAEKDQTMVQLIDASQKILELLANRRDALAAALGNGADAVSALSRLIADNKVELDRILTTLHPTLDVVEKNQATLDTTLAWLGPGFLQQAQAGTNGPWLDVFIRALGPDVPGIMCEVFQPDQPCPGPS
jgi:phospholipid/cholesterol/gamma-HCH transport system substrate-binding protein